MTKLLAEWFDLHGKLVDLSWYVTSVTRWGYFSKVSVSKFHTQVAQMFGDLWGKFHY